MSGSRSTKMIAFGAGIFVIAAAIGLAAMGGSDGDKAETASDAAPRVSVAPAAETTPTPTVPPVKIPTGKEAIELQLQAVQGLAGYTKVGDRVNVYGMFKDRQANGAVKPPPAAKLILSNVEVLAAINNGGTVTYVLAVNPNEAEQIIYLSAFEGIWLTLTRDGAPAVGGTAGHNITNVG